MVGYQLGMHNWRILREEETVELSHDVTFDKTLYPGISTLDPAGLQSPPSLLMEDFSPDDDSSQAVPVVDPPFNDESGALEEN
jgi:hypothetical protein